MKKGWIYPQLKELTSFVIGGDWGKDPLLENGEEFEEVFCIRGSEFKNWGKEKGKTASIRKIKKTSLVKRQLKKGDVLLEISGGGPDQPVGRTVIIDDAALNENGDFPKVCTNFFRLVRFHENLNKQFLNHYLQYFHHSGEVIQYQGGSNNLRNLKFKEYETINIPLPPLLEQNRIVAKLGKLFGQQEIIKASLEKIPMLLKNFRQQVLTQAVTGKLTRTKVKETRLGSLLIDVKYGTSKKSLLGIDGIPVLRIPNIQFGEISDEDLKFSKMDEKEFEKVKLLKGDVLIIRSNGSVSLVGKSAIVREKHINFSYAGYLIRLRCNNLLDPEFLNYSLQSNFMRCQIVDTSRSTSGINNINSNEIKDLKVLLPNLYDQKLIVNRIQQLLLKADKIEDQYHSLTEKIDKLPQAILHKAFKRELVAQLESDGDARELLKEIKELKKI